MSAATVLAGAATRFAIRVPPGDIRVHLRDGLAGGRWRFSVPAEAELIVDFLAPELCSISGVEPLERELDEGFIPTPRLRLDVNGRTYELVSSDADVLERHYRRPRHQEVAYAQPDAWTAGFHLARIRQARRLLHGVSGRVCDIGSGHSLVAMAGPWDFQLFACDRDADAIAVLRERGVEAEVGAADAPPFPPRSFDAVFAGEIVEHLVDPEAALRHWVALLRPGGRLIVTTPNRRHWLARARGYGLVENPEHLFEWDLDELQRAVRRADASVVSVEGLHLPIPVYIPGRGWRDLGFATSHRISAPPRALCHYMGLGRLAPSLAYNLAVVSAVDGA